MDCRLRCFTLVFILLAFQAWAYAQNPLCYYQLVLEDSGDNGWSGAAVSVDVNGIPSTYTLDEGASGLFYIPLSDGDKLTISFLPGTDNEEIFFHLLDQAGSILFSESGEMPFAQGDFSTTVSCPSCTEVPTRSVNFTDVRAFTANLTWRSPIPDGGSFLLRLGTPGLLPDTTNILDVTVQGAQYRLVGLQEMTPYDLYIAQLCPEGDTSAFVGPYSFKTLWANDVAAVGINGPTSDCDLGTADTVEVILQNLGGQPQTLIPFAYSVNGNNIPIDMPRDGVYTGVLGKDSTDLAFFDRTFDFSKPGEYLIQAWTELEADSMRHNDTTELLVVSIPTVSDLPYTESFEAWGGGWTILQNGDTTTWAHGTPDNVILKGTFDGSGAWATGLQGNYGNNELSYLVSPCFDFSNVAEDPVFSVYLKLDLEACCDGLWLEQSVDGGITWDRVGRAGQAINWYNNDRNFWSGRTDWFLASRKLTGLAGNGDVRLRFVLQSDFANVREGVLIDALRLEEQPIIDLAASQLSTPTTDVCGLEEQLITLNIANTGLTPLTAFDVAYQVNGGEVITENVGSLALVSNTQADFTFSTPVNTNTPGHYFVKAWIVFDDDIPENDTAFFSLSSAYPLPFAEDFQNGRIPDGWTIDQDAIITDTHNNPSLALSDNLFDQDTFFRSISPVLGPVREKDSLFFDYRFVNYDGDGTVGTTLGENDRLEVFVSTDCGESKDLVLRIDQSNHITSADYFRPSIDLSGYAGAYIQVIFEVTYGAGDYWFDLDNVSIPACGDALSVIIESTPYINGGSRAIARVEGGNGPFVYEWSTGATAANIVTPQDGGYTVTVTDAFGCQGVGQAIVTKVANLEVLNAFHLLPNPASDQVWIDATFSQPVSGLYRLIHATGQEIISRSFNLESRMRASIDLSSLPSGLYMVQLVVDGQVSSRKLILSSN